MNLYFLSQCERYKELGYSLYYYLKNKKLVNDIKFIKDISEIDDYGYLYSNYIVNNNLNVRLVLPKYEIVKFWDNKINQYENLSKVVRVPYYKVYDSIFQFIRLDVIEKVFISSENSEGGSFCSVFDGNKKDLLKFLNKKSRIRVSEYIEIKKELSVHVVIFPKYNIIGPILKQENENQVVFKSIEYPTTYSYEVIKYIDNISTELRKSGYLGVVGIDLMIDSNSNLYLVEINPRKMGSSLMDSLMFEMMYGYSLPVLEYMSLFGIDIKNRDRKDVDAKWKVSMSKNLSNDNTYLPGIEVDLFKKYDRYSIEYTDYYQINEKRNFTVEWER